MGDLSRACRPRTGGWRYGSTWREEEAEEEGGSRMVGGGCGSEADGPGGVFNVSFFLKSLPKSFFEEEGSDDFVDTEPGEVAFEGTSTTVGKSGIADALIDGRRKSATSSSISSHE